MALFHSPSIVTNGLVLCLDAANRKSYPGSGTTWTDLSGNGRTGTLTSMDGTNFNSANGGSLTFNGSDEFVQCAGSALTLTTATFVAWIRRNGSQGTYDGILLSRGTNVTGMQFYSSDQLGYIWNNAINTYTWNSGLTVPDLTWCMVAVSVTSTTATTYLCQSGGITSATNTVSHTSTVIDDIKVGQDDFGGRFFTGNVAQASLYNRALTATEVAQNYNALKGRYGLS
jgi:hypothetical protein